MGSWISSIDTHTGGEPTRNIVSGIPTLHGNSMIEKARDFSQRYDTLRRHLLFEPRGSEVMSGTILTDPCHPNADIGVIFVEVGGYLPLCGHDTIGLCTALVETRKIEVSEPETSIVLDTPAGLVQAIVSVEGGHATNVRFRGVPSFVLRHGVRVSTPSGLQALGDVAYGGNLYFSVDAAQLGLSLERRCMTDLVRAGTELREAIRQQGSIDHPALPCTDRVTHIQFTGAPTTPGASAANAVIIPPGAVDRSACGTGTAARMAILHALGTLQIGEPFAHEGPLGTTMTGVIVGCTTIGGCDAILPQISGRAFITGFHRFVNNPEDHLDEGFLLNSDTSSCLCSMKRNPVQEEEAP